MFKQVDLGGIPAALKRTFKLENLSFDYFIIHESRKTLAVTVLPSRIILVKAPVEAGEDRVRDLLERRYRWILKQRRYFSQFKAPQKKQYVSGETFRYRGRNYKLLVRRCSENEQVSLHHGTLTVFTRVVHNHAKIKKMLDAWFQLHAKMVFAERFAYCFANFDHGNMPGLLVRKMKRRWGSYSRKTHRVTLNPNLIQAATRHIDYVIIHELCHIDNEHHNKAFYEQLSGKLPGWELLKVELELSLLGSSNT